MRYLYIAAVASGLCWATACGKKNSRNESATYNYYGTTFNIRNSQDTLDTFYTHIRVKEKGKEVVFSSARLERANISFTKNKERRYTSEHLNDVYDIRIEDTVLHFTFMQRYPAGGSNVFLFRGIRQ